MKILKNLYPYIDNRFKNLLAVYIKYQELILSLRFMNPVSSLPPNSFRDMQQKKESSRLLSTISVYCNEEEKKILSRIQEFLALMENLNHIKEYLPLLQGLLAGGNEHDINITDLLGTLLSDEQKEMFMHFSETNHN